MTLKSESYTIKQEKQAQSSLSNSSRVVRLWPNTFTYGQTESKLSREKYQFYTVPPHEGEN